jgi:endonuclease G
MGETLPLDKSELPKKSINTQMIKDYYLEEQPKLTVCGTVVSAHKSGKGHVFINLDKKFPETVFSATVWANDLKNFAYDLTTELMLKQVCITGPVTTFKGTPTTYISGPESLFILGEPEDEN